MRLIKKVLLAGTALMSLSVAAAAHPHVFIDANIEIVRSDEGKFTELRHVWRFDELFSATIILDFDTDGDDKLNEAELKVVTDTIHKSISEFDFFTAIRVGGKPVDFYEPDELKAYFEDGQMIMLLEVEPAKPQDLSKEPVRISISDTSFYVAFDYDVQNISVSGNKNGCKAEVVHPNFDELYADSSQSLTEAFFDDPTNTADLGDEYYSWATIDCT
ncbi:MAG: DUF1007 family protein [Rhizobiaceae bacterium]|nr:DUF1007 family protein [Rhizobiaceae bacterium]